MNSTVTIKPLYVLDTHPMLWYFTESHRLSTFVSDLFASARRGETRFAFSTISVAEMYYAHQKKKLFTDFTKFYATLKLMPYVRLVPLNPEDVLDFKQDAAVPEMHDRIIVGLARRLGAPLVTVDRQIIAAKLVEIAW